MQELNANLHFTDPHNAFKEVEIASKGDGYYFIHPFDGVLLTRNCFFRI